MYGRIAPPPAEVRRTMRGARTECGQFHKSPPSERSAVITVKANKFVCGGGDETKTLIIFIALCIFREPEIILRVLFGNRLFVK